MAGLATPSYVNPRGTIYNSFRGQGYGLLNSGSSLPEDGVSGYENGALYWYTSGSGNTSLYKNVGSPTSSLWEALNSSGSLLTGAGVGITAGTGTVYRSSVRLEGGIYRTTIMIDLTGLASSTTDLDIIGVAGGPAHIGQVTADQNGTILEIRMTCLELPAGGADDIDLYSAVEGTGEFDGAITSLTETALITSGGAWANGTTKGSTAVPTASGYLYLTGGEAGTAATYTAGKFLIELFGYAA